MSASHNVKPPFASALAAIACLMSLPAGGQVFGPEGAEYQIIGPIAGDQMHAALALRDGYGFVVWQDSRSDGEGSGIGARQLGGTFNSGTSPSFRVNSSRGGDQEKPKVAVLTDKSTLFVWQTGTEGAQKIVGRILLANGAFAGQEFDISDPAAGASIDPDIAALPGGKAAVTWSTFGPDGDLQGVFGQVIGSGGISPEGFVFQANQFFRFNQRNPSVSALSDGRFVIAWISEQQRLVGSEAGTKPSVDVYARIFESSGEPASLEFRLNESNQICANPSIAGLQGGGFLASWTERSLIRSNSWDVRVSWHSSSGAAVGSKQLANSFLPGDQILPSVAVLGDRQLVAWTSTYQDGNREGVYAQLFRNGAKVGDEFRVNDWILGRQIHPVVASDNQNRLAVVWSSFVGTQGFDLHAKRYSLAGTLPSPDSPMAVPFGFGGIQVSWAPVGGYPSASFE
ncbi:MAG: hypothetical protein FJ405_09025, partial [Verrucomicrobia bacterium]|nr:hypothetical protein [Verrucomicrobiota bacterium]